MASLSNSKSDDYKASDVIISENRYSNRCKYLMGSVLVNIGRIVKLVCRYRWEIA